MKDSFILYNSFYEPIKELKNEQLGKLLRAIFDYTINGEITQDSDILIAFMFIKNQLDMDAKKWQDIRQKRSEAGKKHKGNQYTKSNKMEQMKQNGTNGSVNENVNVNVDVNVNNKYIYYSNKKLNDIFKEFLQVRKKLRAVNSDRAIKMLINKLSNYDDDTKYLMIEQSIVNSWKDVYELKGQKEKKKEEDVPYWFYMTDEELKNGGKK